MLEKYKLNRRNFLKKIGLLSSLLLISKPFQIFAISKPEEIEEVKEGFKLIDFAQVSDVHITDGANPLRVELLDNIPGLGDAWRPQQHMSATTFDAVVRSVNDQNSYTPLDFAILTGDQVDNAMENEFQWLIDVAEGNAMSSDYNALVALGEMTPVSPVGVDVSWYAALGNHDTMLVGNLPSKLMEAIHKNMEEKYGFEITSQEEVIELLYDHGFHLMPSSNDGYYSFSQNEFVHCIVLNTNNDNWLEGLVEQFFISKNKLIDTILNTSELIDLNKIIKEILTAFIIWIKSLTHDVLGGIAFGTLDQNQLVWMKEEIENNSDKLCVVFSHHGPESFMSPPGNVTPEELVNSLCSYENVIAHVFGHSHHNIIKREESTEGCYWSINTCSVIEYPQEWRRVSIWDNGDGTGQVSCRMFQHDYIESIEESHDDPQSEVDKHYGEAYDRDVDLDFSIPASVAANIAANKPASTETIDDKDGKDNDPSALQSDVDNPYSFFGNDDLKCFIATAAYGSPLYPEVATLRLFRDAVLRQNKIGRLFIQYYYQFSPPIAKIIESQPLYRHLIRGVLNPVILIVKKFLKV